jgi:hypothetical protein
MSDDDKDAELYQFTPPPPRPGAAPRKPRRSRLTKTAAGLAVILGTGAGGAAVASATSAGSASNMPAASASAPGSTPPRAPGPMRRGFFVPGFLGPAAGQIGMLGFGTGPGAAIHGSFTVKGPSGAYETIDTQYGTAEAVSSSSITVKSDDGFSQTYVVGSSTIVFAEPNGILSVKAGDTVSVQGLVSGSTVKAERVLDVTQVKAHRGTTVPVHPSWPGGPGRPGGSGGSGGTGGSAA